MAMPKIEFEKFTLPNGLQLILHIDQKLPVVHVNQWFHVGSKNERSGRTGFAHLFEHLMFQGSKNTTGDYFACVEKAGANLREKGVNGTTDFDRTNYFATVPSGNLEYILWIESDRLATLDEALTQEKFDLQRDVVKNERRQRYENEPYGRAFMLITEHLHPAGHPYSWDVIGSHEDLTAATLDDARLFFHQFYSPNNLSLVIAGDFHPDEAKRLVIKYFGSIPSGPALDRPRRWLPSLAGEKSIDVRDRVSLDRIYIAWPAPAFFDADEPELNHAAAILSDGLAARLPKMLLYDRQICSDVYAANISNELSGLFLIMATARPGVSLDEIDDAIMKEIGELAKNGPTPAELSRAQIKREYAFIAGLERIGGFGGKADLLNLYNVYLGSPDCFDRDVLRHRQVGLDRLRSTFARWLDSRNRLVVRFRPEISGRVSCPDVDHSVSPPLGTDRPFHVPEVQTMDLENGLRIFVVERHELPKVSVTLVTRAGSTCDSAGKEGAAYLTLQTVDKGTSTRSALEIEQSLGDLGTAIERSIGREYLMISFDVLTENLLPALGIFSEAVLNPIFPESECEREKKLLSDDLAQEETVPSALAARIRSMLTFGHIHPYGRPYRGFPSTIAGLAQTDLASIHRSRWQPGGSALIFAGDITLADASNHARMAFGKWARGKLPGLMLPQPRPSFPGRICIVDRQDAAQTYITLAIPGPKRTTSDYYAFRLADAIWGGGGFRTRLNLNLREKKGYSYGVSSSMALYRNAGMWSAQGSVQTDKTAEAVVEFFRELKGMAGEMPITIDELNEAKTVRIRGYAQQFETLSRIGGQIAELWAAGIPITEMLRVTDEISKTTRADVDAAARRYSTPKQSTILLIGDRSKIEPQVRALNLGEVVILDARGSIAQ